MSSVASCRASFIPARTDSLTALLRQLKPRLRLARSKEVTDTDRAFEKPMSALHRDLLSSRLLVYPSKPVQTSSLAAFRVCLSAAATYPTGEPGSFPADEPFPTLVRGPLPIPLQVHILVFAGIGCSGEAPPAPCQTVLPTSAEGRCFEPRLALSCTPGGLCMTLAVPSNSDVGCDCLQVVIACKMYLPASDQ